MTVADGSLALAILCGASAVAVRFSHRFRELGFTLAVIGTGCLALARPEWLTSWGGIELKPAITPLVQVILLGMGLTLTTDDFRRVLVMPRGVILCCVLHYTIMPIGGYCYGRLFGLEGAMATGLILIGSVPSGSASNVISLLARANVPLSVTVTAVSTLISPFVTPFAMRWLAGAYLKMDPLAMMLSIFRLIILPLLVGLAIHHYLPRVARQLSRWLPLLAMAAICLIIGVTIALSRTQLLTAGLALFGAAACHNATGYVLGYWGGKLAGLNEVDARTTALEVGIQNGGMATALAFDVLKAPVAALGSAVFGPWSAVTASALASWWRHRATPSSATAPAEGTVPAASTPP